MLLTNGKIESLDLSSMHKNMVKGLLEKRNEDIKKYSELKSQVEKVFGSRKIKEIHTISDGMYVIEQPNPFKKLETDSDSYFEVMVDGKKAYVGTLSLDAAIILAVCFKNGESDLSKYIFKILNIE